MRMTYLFILKTIFLRSSLLTFILICKTAAAGLITWALGPVCSIRHIAILVGREKEKDNYENDISLHSKNEFF